MEKIKMYSKTKLEIKELIDITNPKLVYVYLTNNSECLLKKDDIVEKHSLISENIYSPISGKIIDICEKRYIDNKFLNCVVIENDFKETSKDKVIDNIEDYSKEDFIKVLQDCNVIGMGGSGFPSYIKYKSDIKTLIINCCECEPYLSCDSSIFYFKNNEIISAIKAIIKINNIKDCYFAVEKDNVSVIEKFKETNNIKLKKVKNYYSSGYERLLIKDILKIKYDKYPTEKNIVVSNVSTIYAMYKALKYNKPITKRIITVVYNNNPINILVKIGTTVKEILSRLDIKEDVVVLNGLMMGNVIDDLHVGITSKVSSIFIIKKEEYKSTECMRCGKCNYYCSQGLSPVLIKDNYNNKEMLKKLNVDKCNECGICSYVCPAKIDLKNIMKELKK